jgi:hypothetical protein
MPPIAVDAKREIVEDFARLIRERQTAGPKPATAVIHFRNEKRDLIERPVMVVPISFLRYRADNGRIASDVMNYEKVNGPLDEKDSVAQLTLEKFLAEKDPEKMEILMRSMEHTGQNEPAIITCDGFLINGNRRRMVLARLQQQTPGRPEFEAMKVVVLPGPNDPGGPPTLIEIERLENRYQLQSEGKSEYYGFDRALSIKRKMSHGFRLEEQLRDDPRYANADDKEIAQAIRETERDYLRPLECVDRYLQTFGREKLYSSVSAGPSDSEGRWQAFIDYSSAYHRYFRNPKWLLSSGVEEEDIGSLEDAAFKMIRLRTLKGLPKIHMVMRQLPKLAAVKESRKELLKICDEVDASLPAKECFDSKGNPLSPEANDRMWVEQYQASLIHRVKKAYSIHETAEDKETPIALLEAALRKLTHDEMSVRKIAVEDFGKGRKLAADIQARAKEIEGDIFHFKKELDSLGRKK